jgi:hypothetical protein
MSSKGMDIPIPKAFDIVVSPEEKTPKREYIFSIKAISEDGTTETLVEGLVIDVRDAPGGDESTPLTDDITDVLPFLSVLPNGLIIPAFLIIVLLIVAAIAFIGIMINRFTSKRKKATDPITERIRTYKDLYGQDPTDEEIATWKLELEKASSPVVPVIVKEVTPEDEVDLLDDSREEGVLKEEAEKETSESDEKEEDDLLDRLFDE